MHGRAAYEFSCQRADWTSCEAFAEQSTRRTGIRRPASMSKGGRASSGQSDRSRLTRGLPRHFPNHEARAVSPPPCAGDDAAALGAEQSSRAGAERGPRGRSRTNPVTPGPSGWASGIAQSPIAGLKRTPAERARYLCSAAGVYRLTRRPGRRSDRAKRSRGWAGPDDPDRGEAQAGRDRLRRAERSSAVGGASRRQACS